MKSFLKEEMIKETTDYMTKEYLEALPECPHCHSVVLFPSGECYHCDHKYEVVEKIGGFNDSFVDFGLGGMSTPFTITYEIVKEKDND